MQGTATESLYRKVLNNYSYLLTFSKKAKKLSVKAVLFLIKWFIDDDRKWELGIAEKGENASVCRGQMSVITAEMPTPCHHCCRHALRRLLLTRLYRERTKRCLLTL